MPDPITWWVLAKEVGDNQSILEAIDAQILAHNLDASAHGQSDEVVYNHRISALLDHVNYSIYNIKIAPESRTVKAFVDAGGACEFTHIQDAIDYTYAHGGGRVFVKAGTYLQTTDLILYSNIYLEGEDDDTTIIDFQDSQYEIKAIGTNGLHKRNIHVSHIQVTGSLVSWEGAIYFNYVDDSSVVSCQFKDNYDAGAHSALGVRFENCERCVLENGRFINNNSHISIAYGGHNIVKYNECDTSFVSAIIFSQTENFQCLFNIINTPGASGIDCEAEPFDALIHGNYVNGATSYGVFLAGSARSIVTENNVQMGAGYNDGIRLEGGSKNIVSNNFVSANEDATGIALDTELEDIVSSNRVTLCDTGIDVSNAGCNRCLIHGNIVYDIINTAIHNAGTSTLVADNITA